MFSNTEPGKYDGNDWDMGTIFERSRYYLKTRERNRRYVKPGDIGVIRIYGDGFWGRFRVAGEWVDDPKGPEKYGGKATGHFPIENVVRWNRPLPQSLVWTDLSTNDQRSRLVRISPDDVTTIEVAQRIYERLGFGFGDGQIVVLEQGIEEAIKPNLKRMGLSLASPTIREQFSMGPGVGRSDLICIDGNGDLVVIELKRGMSSNEVVGQVLTYVGYVRQNIAKKGQKVHGWIVTGSYDEALRLAASAADVRVLVVRLP